MVASIASPMVTRTLSAVEQPRAPIAHLLYDRRDGRTRKDGPPGLPANIGDKPLKRLDSRKEVRFGFRSVRFGFRSRRTLILFRLVLISFRRILNSFHASWRLERGGVDPFGLRRCKLASGPAQLFEKARFAEGKSLDFPSPSLDFPSSRLGLSFLLLGFSVPRFAQKENSAAAGGLAPVPPPCRAAKWARGTARRAVEGARNKRGGGFADIEGWSCKAAALSQSAPGL